MAAGLAGVRVSQVAFLRGFLFAFGKGKGVAALRASDFDIWHVAFSMSDGEVSPLSALPGASESSSVSSGC